jgi:hypothetical protein
MIAAMTGVTAGSINMIITLAYILDYGTRRSAQELREFIEKAKSIETQN